MSFVSLAFGWFGQIRLVAVALLNEVRVAIVLARIELLRSGVPQVGDLQVLDHSHRAMLREVQKMRQRVAGRKPQVWRGSLHRGVTNREVSLSDSDPAWSDEAKRELDVLRVGLGSEVEVHHIGSTAVAELAAKPIIDLAIALPAERFAQIFPETKRVLTNLGYRYVGMRGGLFFEKGPTPIRTHALQVHTVGGEVLLMLLHFRDLLRREAGLRRDYAMTKAAIAAHLSRRRWIYAIYKGHWIQEQQWRGLGAAGWGEWFVAHRRAQMELARVGRVVR